MKKIALFSALALAVASCLADAQTFTTSVISAQKLLNVDKTPLNGTVVVTLTNSSDTPVTYTPQGGSASSATFTANVVNGQIQPVSGFPFNVPAAATTTPAGIVYRVDEINASSVTVLTLPKTLIAIQYYSLDGYIAQAGTPITGTGVPVLQNCAPGAQYTDTTATTVPYACSAPPTPDSRAVWTQNPSQNPMCPSAVAYPATTNPYCLPSTSAYLLPGYSIANGGSQPGPPTAAQVAGSTVNLANGIVAGTGTGSSNSRATAAQVAATLAAATGCSTAGLVYSPASGACIAAGAAVPVVVNNAVTGSGASIQDAGSPPLLINQPTNANAVPLPGSDANGIPSNTYAALLLGNSTVAAKGGGWVRGVCEAAVSGAFVGGICRQGTQISCNSSALCTLNIDNHDGFFKVGNWYSGGGSQTTCLTDGPYLLTAATTVSITFSGITSDTNCASVTGSNTNYVTDLVNKFGADGGRFSDIYAGTSNWEYPNLKTVAALELTQGKVPILWTITNHINNVRQFLTDSEFTNCPASGSFLGVVCDMSGLLGDWWSAHPSSPAILIEEETQQQGHGSNTTYMCPEGTTHAGNCTQNSTVAATISSGISATATSTSASFFVTSGVATVNTASGTVPAANSYIQLASFTTATYFNGLTVQVTAVTGSTYSFNTAHANVGSSGTPTTDATGVSTNTNTVTLSFCPLSLWGGAGSTSSVIAPDGVTQYQVLLDTTGSGVQETVSLVNLTPSGSSCTISFPNTNAHSSGAPVIATEATAAIQMGVTLHQSYLALLGKFRNLTGFATQQLVTGTMSPIYSATNAYYGSDPLHLGTGSILQGKMLATTSATLANTFNKQVNQDAGSYLDLIMPLTGATVLQTPRLWYPRAIDPLFSPQAAAGLRFTNIAAGTYNQLETASPAYLLGAEDPFFFRTMIAGQWVPGSWTPTVIALSTPSTQTGNVASAPIAGLDEICLVGVSCFAPTTFTTAATSTISTALTVNSNPWLAYAQNTNSAYTIAWQRPVMADQQFSLAYYNSPSFHQDCLGSVISTTTGTPSTFTLGCYALGNGTNGNASELSTQAGDVVVVRGVGATKLATTVTCAPVATAGSTNLVCSDSAGTSYATWTNGSIMDIYSPRPIDHEFGNVIVGPSACTVSTTNFCPSFTYLQRAKVFTSATTDDLLGWQNVPLNGASNPIAFETLTHPKGGSHGFGLDASGASVARLPVISGSVGTTIASATTIAPTAPVTEVSGAVAIATITPLPNGACTTTAFFCQITLIPTGAFTTTTAGNISIASTAVVGKALVMTYVVADSKWYPSY